MNRTALKLIQFIQYSILWHFYEHIHYVWMIFFPHNGEQKNVEYSILVEFTGGKKEAIHSGWHSKWWKNCPNSETETPTYTRDNSRWYNEKKMGSRFTLCAIKVHIIQALPVQRYRYWQLSTKWETRNRFSAHSMHVILCEIKMWMHFYESIHVRRDWSVRST